MHNQAVLRDPSLLLLLAAVHSREVRDRQVGLRISAESVRSLNV